MDKKFTLSDATDEEKKAFMDDFTALTTKHSMYAEVVPQLERMPETNNFVAKGFLLLQKMTEKVEVEVVQEGAVPSTDPEINPTLPTED